MKRIPFFRAGRHRSVAGADLAFSEADLRRSAEVYDPAQWRAPLVIGHPQMDAPAWGGVDRVEFSDGLLAAIPGADIEPQFAEMVRSGRFPHRSGSFYTPHHPAHPLKGSAGEDAYYLRHVGFLGSTPPAIKGLPGVQFADDADGCIEISFAEGDADDGALWRQFTGWLERHLGADEVQFAEALSTAPWDGSASRYADAAAYCEACLVDGNEAGKPKVAAQCHLPVQEPNGKLNRNALLAAQAALAGARGGVKLAPAVKRAAAKKLAGLMKTHDIAPAASLAKLAEFSESTQEVTTVTTETDPTAEFAEREADITRREKLLAEREAKARREGCAEFVERFVAGDKRGRVLPAEKAGIVELLVQLEAAQPVEFAEGETTVKKAPAQILREFIEALPVRVDFSERARGSSERSKKEEGLADRMRKRYPKPAAKAA